MVQTVPPSATFAASASRASPRAYFATEAAAATNPPATAAAYRVLLLIGDDFQDLVSFPTNQNSIAGRREILGPNQPFFGDRWFLIPNPMFGSRECVLQR